jgi:hypothetical protein
VYIRALGKPDGTTDMWSGFIDEYGNEWLSLEVIELSRGKGKSSFEDVTKELTTIYVDITDDGIDNQLRYKLFDNELWEYFWDYDNITTERLVEELEHIQREKQVGNFYIYETREKGRHAVCIDALRFKDVKDVIDYSNCDLMFKKAPRINEYRCWVLRFAKKGKRPAPKYLYTIKSPFEGKNLQSRGHAKYLLKFGVKMKLLRPFGPEEIEAQEYNTGKRTK